MYPVLPFINGEYSWDDLPDAVVYEYSYGSITLQKQPSGTIDPLDGARRIYYAEIPYTYGGVEYVDKYRITDEFLWPRSSPSVKLYQKWQIQNDIDAGEDIWNVFCGDVAFGDCLIGLNGSCFDLIVDEFANSYSVSGPISGIVIRRSVPEGENPTLVNCQYSGTGLSLRYSSTTYKWQLNGNPKIGFQNTPVGSYAGGYTIS
jgi:hypothetical protein